MNRTCLFRDHRSQFRCTECGLTVEVCLCPAVDDQAMRRIVSNQGVFLKRVRDELTLADERAEPNHLLLAKLMAQVGQLSDKLISHKKGEGASAQEIMQSLIQASVLVTRIAIEGDQDFSFDPVSVFGEDSFTR